MGLSGMIGTYTLPDTGWETIHLTCLMPVKVGVTVIAIAH